MLRHIYYVEGIDCVESVLGSEVTPNQNMILAQFYIYIYIYIYIYEQA